MRASSKTKADMIHPTHILALSEPKFVKRQLRSVLGGSGCDERRTSFWRGWGFEQP